jgi:hypothetical protein
MERQVKAAGKFKFRRSQGSQAELESEKMQPEELDEANGANAKGVSVFASTPCLGLSPCR